MKKFTIFSLFVFFSLLVTDISLSQVNTPSLSPEEAKVVKPLVKIVEGWDKKDMELFMSAYHEKAVIETAAGTKVNKDGLKKILKQGMGGIHLSYDVEKIEITGDKASIECVLKWGDRIIPRKFDLIKQEDSWLIIGQWLL